MSREQRNIDRDNELARLLRTQAQCQHRWEEQPGEPPRDVCIKCGAERE